MKARQILTAALPALALGVSACAKEECPIGARALEEASEYYAQKHQECIDGVAYDEPTAYSRLNTLLGFAWSGGLMMDNGLSLTPLSGLTCTATVNGYEPEFVVNLEGGGNVWVGSWDEEANQLRFE